MEAVDQIIADSAAEHSRPTAARLRNHPVRRGRLATERESIGVQPPIIFVLHSSTPLPPILLVLLMLPVPFAGVYFSAKSPFLNFAGAKSLILIQPLRFHPMHFAQFHARSERRDCVAWARRRKGAGLSRRKS